MLNKKIKSLIERTKVLFKERKKEICLGALGVVLLGTIGFAVAGLSNTDSKEVASNNKTSITEKEENNKKEDKNKTDKKEENKKEDSKKEDSTKEETKVESDKKEESTSEGTETSSKEESKSESSNIGSSSSNNEVANKPSNGGGSSSSNGGGNSNTPNSPAHSHSWNPVTDTVWHDEVGHYETVVIKDAWTEEVPIYEEQEVYICNGCKKDITADPDTHMYEALLAGNTKCAGYSSEWKQVQVGTDKINHPAVTEDRWVVDKAAWSETVTTGYKCSCGATK